MGGVDTLGNLRSTWSKGTDSTGITKLESYSLRLPYTMHMLPGKCSTVAILI